MGVERSLDLAAEAVFQSTPGIPVCSLRRVIVTVIHLKRAGNTNSHYSFCTLSPARRPSRQGVRFLTGKILLFIPLVILHSKHLLE